MALGHIYRITQDIQGNVVTGVLATVRLNNVATLAALFSDEAGTLPLPNPVTNNAQYGSIAVYLAAGLYDIEFVKAGYTFETQQNIQVLDPAQGVTTLTGTANQVIVSSSSGNVTLSTPQNIDPNANVQFQKIGVNTTPHATYRLDVNGVAQASQLTLGGHSPTGVLDVQGSVVASDGPGNYFSARLWPVAPSGAVNVFGLRLEALTGAAAGSALFGGLTVVEQPASTALVSAANFNISAGSPSRYNLYVPGTAPNYFAGEIRSGTSGSLGLANVHIMFGASTSALVTRPTPAGTVYPVLFQNNAGTSVGSIATTDTATAYNTSSDARLKHAITPLTDALATLRQLRPVQFFWNSDDRVGRGFLASEVQPLVPEAITGDVDGMNEDGTIRPQMIDYSKLVPWLTAALQEVLARIEALEGAAHA